MEKKFYHQYIANDIWKANEPFYIGIANKHYLENILLLE